MSLLIPSQNFLLSEHFTRLLFDGTELRQLRKETDSSAAEQRRNATVTCKNAAGIRSHWNSNPAPYHKTKKSILSDNYRLVFRDGEGGTAS